MSGTRAVVGRRGALIAFVGSEATGKSTIIEAVHRSLSGDRIVQRIHAGKPPATPLTFVPHSLLPTLRGLFPGQRFTHVERELKAPERTSPGPFPLLFGVRAAMLAYERRALLARAARSAARGEVVLCDRYPSSRSGAPDSPQLTHLPASDPVRRRIAVLEARWYRDVPAPDLVVALTAPLDVTLARNASRGKVEPEEHVRFRHSLSANLEFDGARVVRLDTDRPLETVLEDVDRAIAAALEPTAAPRRVRTER
jgi:thymidylate kinase